MRETQAAELSVARERETSLLLELDEVRLEAGEWFLMFLPIRKEDYLIKSLAGAATAERDKLRAELATALKLSLIHI